MSRRTKKETPNYTEKDIANLQQSWADIIFMNSYYNVLLYPAIFGFFSSPLCNIILIYLVLIILGLTLKNMGILRYSSLQNQNKNLLSVYVLAIFLTTQSIIINIFAFHWSWHLQEICFISALPIYLFGISLAFFVIVKASKEIEVNNKSAYLFSTITFSTGVILLFISPLINIDPFILNLIIHAFVLSLTTIMVIHIFYMLWKKDRKEVWKNIHLKFITIIVVLGFIMTSFNIYLSHHYPSEWCGVEYSSRTATIDADKFVIDIWCCTLQDSKVGYRPI